ncbi:hypothetical protein [uncultured Psychroserpens sp.]|uniref:hypothetical protein n=1 Tax=uncultured Psychroserpens sp. TaxID=255436 RepID=UPI00261A9B1E|nr:hypothetical protein [uncultured Psychroserpens sp.]
MDLKKIFIIVISCFCFQTVIAQELTEEQKERLEYRVDVFLSDNEEIQALWYEDLMDRMKLKGDTRVVYHNVVKYHAYKMKRLDNPNIKLSKKQIKSEIQKQVKLLNEDVKEILDSDQLKLHKAGWNAILKAITKKINDN